MTADRVCFLFELPRGNRGGGEIRSAVVMGCMAH